VLIPSDSVTCAISPLILISTTRPINWFRPLMRRKFLNTPGLIT
jgi:hypothetical protein